ncbi:MAG: crotonase/enoyl-CoA hydratase family protein [Hoeflea sp.]|uniref:crotonase/enoyl-CoA hydratase family protein n=1 Tax=Hoeflea sp. TaxID=1940281 RepID=UPI001E098475|nr:crotonase/enoyl-CoA hydratase family protein [Hoeflea sp.]MBU4531190.1 crotonase/enoyl-CoA hydratase family protein [Alphaproteobacteria bacterium]MBU4545748.1 crotonase/enoyl-CoA hydratase family protein [Alphaproteobacteria bacterium]MBU4550717.1 crotonase/enoyl-CoA hydratase family protein [Alphaproteobacteria bacterium]MBV1724467.1 crotonase/enoyl-CoA hydratase family protein [Hoeflea sp.]MBV1760487.1 crotonase/enoyl-CoA hydratase family protein [Hoeflea sp.]
MSYACFTLEIADHIAHIRFNRPDKANSMTMEFWRELPEAIDRISNGAEARVIVISSEGKHFTSGMDISVFMSGSLDADPGNIQVSAEAFRHKIKLLQKTFSALERARQPVLAAIQGGAIGAGVDLVTACDCRYASADAFFAVQETAIGMTADVGTFPRLVRLIPEGWARQMAYTAERLPAEKAREIGLVNEVFETHEALLEGVMAIARKIALHSPLAVSGCKAMANYSRDHSTADALDYVSVWNAAMLRPEDIKEAFVAKGEKRQPVFGDLKPIAG